MMRVDYRLPHDIVLEIHSLRGELARTSPGSPVNFDDSESFQIRIDRAEIAITPASLTALMNSYALAYDGAPIKGLKLTIRGDQLIERGTLHKGIDLRFEIAGSLSTQDGNIRMHAKSIKTAGVPVAGLLHLFGEDLSKFFNEKAGRGMRIEGDDIVLIPKALTPPPHIDGRVVHAAVANNKIVLSFDSGMHLSPLAPPLASKAYIYNHGGVVRFGKLTMNDTDLELVGNGPGVFEYCQTEYLKQLTAGYTKTTEVGGLIAHMVDYSRLHSGRKTALQLRSIPQVKP